MSIKSRGLHRPLYLRAGEHRTPMHRFLLATQKRGSAEPEYNQQWRTLWKAYELGYISGGSDGLTGKITKKGEVELARLIKKEGK